MIQQMIGNFAFSKAGHDKGKLYVIIAQDEEYVYLCDGRLHPLEKTKKKRYKHVQLIHKKVNNEKLLFDYEIKYAIDQYKKKEETYV